MTPPYLTAIAVIVVTFTLYYIATSPSNLFSPSASPHSSMASTTTTPHSNYVWLVQLEFHPGKKEEVQHLPHPYATTPVLITLFPSHSLITFPPLSLLPLPSLCQWLTFFKPIAAHVRDFEPRCLSYELYDDTKDPNRVMIFERYATEEDLTVTHRQSVPFLTLRARSQEAQFVKEYKSAGYWETNIGFVSRKE